MTFSISWHISSIPIKFFLTTIVNGTTRPCREDLVSIFPHLSKSVPIKPFVLAKIHCCAKCNAVRYQFEPKGFCCLDGQVTLVSSPVPNLLWELYTSSSIDVVEFQRYVRTSNNTLAFTSLRVKYNKQLCQNDKGIYTSKAYGQMYHYLNSLLLTDDHPSYLQLYFYDQ